MLRCFRFYFLRLMAMIFRWLTSLGDECGDGFSVFVARVTALLMSVLRQPELNHTPGVLKHRPHLRIVTSPKGHLDLYQNELYG